MKDVTEEQYKQWLDLWVVVHPNKSAPTYEQFRELLQVFEIDFDDLRHGTM